jgi:hypothetical protein
MAVIPLPSGIRDVEWTFPPRAAWVSKSGFSGKATIIDRGTVTEGYKASITVVPRTIEQNRQWNAWEALMKGPVNTVELSPTDGTQDGVVVASVAFQSNTAAGVSSFVVYASVPNDTMLLRAGSFVQIGTRLHILTQDLPFGAETPFPRAGMFIDPPLAAAAVANQAIFVRNPVCSMRLISPVLGYKVSPGGIYEPMNFRLEEAL